MKRQTDGEILRRCAPQNDTQQNHRDKLPVSSLQSLASSLRASLLIVFTLAYLLGQVCAAWGWFVGSPLWFGSIAVLSLAIWVCAGLRPAVLVGSLLLFFCGANVALQRVLAPHFPPEHLRQLSLPQQVQLEGWLFREPEYLPQRGRLYLEALRVWRNGTPYPATGKILLTVRSLTHSWHYGDVLRLSVRLRIPRNFHTPGSFDYEGYLARQGIYLSAFLWDDSAVTRIGAQGSRIRSWIEHTRRNIGSFFDSSLDPQAAAVLRALIIGDEGRISKDVREAFSRAGVAHVLSISGLHLSLVAAAAYGAWWWLLGWSRYLLLCFSMPKLAALLTIPLVLVYAGLAGGKVATWRSVIMVLVYLFAILIDRRQEVYRSLALAALLISLLWPGAVLEISFQLSFLAILGILLGMDQFSRWWSGWRENPRLALHPGRERALRWGAAYVAVSVFALFSTAPVTAAYFNQIAWAGLFANMLVVPLLGSLAVILGLIAAGFSFLHTGLAGVILFCAGMVTRAGTWIVMQIGTWPSAALDVVTPTLLEVVLLYGLFACLLLQVSSLKSPVSHVPRYLLPVLLAALSLDTAFWVWHRYFHRDLRVTFLDVGQGDATVIELPGSQVMVIDGGGFASEDFDVGEAVLAPFLWSRKIGRVDIIVLSHPQLDHYGGLTFVTEHFSPREFWFTGEQARGERFSRLMRTIERGKVSVRRFCSETPPMHFAEVQVQVLHPPCQPVNLDTNDASLVLRLSFGETHILLTGDIEAEGEGLILASGLPLASAILKVPHHGSRTSSSRAFVQAVAPHIAVASLGYTNRFSFPAPAIVQRYAELGSRFLRTDQSGTISVLSDGQVYRVETVIPASEGR
jgi:competence protein ComEC